MNDLAHAPDTPEPGTRLLRLDVLRTLRQDILSCRLAPGAELREAELAERFAVSKSPVRDALSRLVQEGLVMVMPRQGYRVAPISVKDVSDMFEYRAVLEAAGARIAAEGASDEALRSLDRFRAYDAATWPDGFTHYNREFHHAIAGLSGNARLETAASGQIDQMDRVVTVSVNAMRGHDPARVVVQHCGIIDALQAKDPRRASSLMARHVLEARKRVVAALSRLAILE
jgi:DNA-binding GntR family transcriptional regulator